MKQYFTDESCDSGDGTLTFDTVTDVQLSRSHDDSDVCWEGHSQIHQLINGSSRQSNKHKALS